MYNWLTSGTQEKKLGVFGGDDLKNNNDDLKRPKNVEILVAPPSEWTTN